MMGSGQLKAYIAERLPLEQAADAHRLLESREVVGGLCCCRN
jgi:hypothetical protein